MNDTKPSSSNGESHTKEQAKTGVMLKVKSVVTVKNPSEQSITAANPASYSSGQVVAVFLAALATSGLLLLCFFPVAWSWPAWFALVPSLALVRTNVAKTWVYLASWASGLCFFSVILSWMTLAHPLMTYAWIALFIYCSLYMPVSIWLLRVIDRSLAIPMTFSVPAVWVTLDFARSIIMTGFPWYFLGHSQHDNLLLVQIVDLGGVYMVTFLVCMVNGLLFEFLYANSSIRSLFGLKEPALEWRYRLLKPRWIQAGIVGGVIIATISYGYYRMQEVKLTLGPTVSLLQGNIPQYVRNEASAPDSEKDGAKKIANHSHMYLCYHAVGQRPIVDAFENKVQFVGKLEQSALPDLIVWPETTYFCPNEPTGGFWIDHEITPGEGSIPKDAVPENYVPDLWRQIRHADEQYIEFLASQRWKTNVLLGVNTKVWAYDKDNETDKEEEKFRQKNYTSALMVNAKSGIGQRYDKQKRVAFGEYIPMREWFPFLNYFSPYDYDFSISKGKELTRFELGKYRFGVLICYEDTHPSMARQYGVATNDGPAVDFIINMSNDAWFCGSSEHNEHLAICRFRAIETRRSVARAVNMGISAVIDSNGRLLVPNPSISHRTDDIDFWEVGSEPIRNMSLPVSFWSEFKQRQGILTAPIPLDERTSFYSLWGDWFATVCTFLIGVCLVWYFFNRKHLIAKEPKALLSPTSGTI